MVFRQGLAVFLIDLIPPSTVSKAPDDIVLKIVVPIVTLPSVNTVIAFKVVIRRRSPIQISNILLANQILPIPITVEASQLACVLCPIAVEISALANVFSPIAVDFDPLACVLCPNAVE